MLKWQWVYFPSFGNASYKIKKPYVQYHCIGVKGNKLKEKTEEKDFEKKNVYQIQILLISVIHN